MTVVYSAENEAYRKTKAPAALLPLLVILFIVSYGILTMLVFEQGQTIESQRGLIREMLKDSSQLASMKGKLNRDDVARQQDKATGQAEINPGTGAAAAGNKATDKSGKKP